MTLEELKTCEKATLTAADVAPVLDCDPHAIRLAAKTQPELLNFPVMVIGKRVKIPRIPFLRALGYEVDV